MDTSRKSLWMKITVTISYLAMIAVNALANILPINGIQTGEVSDTYTNLFAPTGLTFSIWGVIYLLLLGFVLYQWGLFQKREESIGLMEELLQFVRIPFIISSIANAVWLFTWHYDLIGLSTVFMLIILVSLIVVSRKLTSKELTVRDWIFLKLPFSIYFGWITIATIANITTMLVSWNWNGFGLSEDIWTVMTLLAGVAIGMITMFRNKDLAYGAVILWGYIGILIKHQASSGWNGQYGNVIVTLYISIALTIVAALFLIYKRRFERFK